MSENFSNRTLTRIIDLAKRKKSLMKEIFNITTLQSGLLTPEKAEDLLTAIGRKQEHINEISQIDVEVLPLEKELLRWHSITSWDNAPKDVNKKWQEISTLRQQTVLLAKETRQIEAENLARISTEYRKLKIDMALLYTKRGSAKAYRGNDRQTDGYFVDNKY
jgi:GTPase SAR1 family protein